MYNLYKAQSHKHICDLEDGYASSDDLRAFKSMLLKGISAEKSSQFIIHGNRHSGKHAFVVNAFKSEEKPLLSIHSSEILDGAAVDICRLNKAMRVASSVSFKEHLKVVEGEVVNITFDRIHLKTKDMESTFEIGVRMRNELQKERVSIGDVVRIYKESGFVNRIGRSANSQTSSSSNLYPVISLPEGECIKTEVVITKLSLDELDVLNYREDGEELLYTGVYVSSNIQNEVGKKVSKWIKEAKATFIRGSLVIDDSQLLNENGFVSIMAMAREPLSPNVIFILNGVPAFRNCGELRIFIDRLCPDSITRILQSVASASDSVLEEGSIKLLQSLALRTSISTAIGVLRSSIQSNKVSTDSVTRITSLFDFCLG